MRAMIGAAKADGHVDGAEQRVLFERQGGRALRTRPAADDDNLLYRIDRVHMNAWRHCRPLSSLLYWP